MKVLLINPSFNRYAGIKGHGGLSAPLNLAYLAAYLRLHRPDAEISILDAEAHGLSYKETVSRACQFAPGLIGITATTPSFDVITELIRRLHHSLPKSTIILGGPHATGSPEECAALDGVAAAVQGEGEATFLEIYDAERTGNPLHVISGLCLETNGNIQHTPKRPLIADIDALPFPARDLLPMHLYYSPPTKSISEARAANIISARGCPFHCSFCLSDMMWAGKYRYRSPGNIVQEIEHLATVYGIREFNFNDDLFTSHKARLMDFCQLLIDRDLRISWVCMSRSDFIDPKLLQLMKRAGCGKIALGLESGSQDVLAAMQKKLDPNTSARAIAEIKKAGIRAGASFVIGHIGETEETIRQTIRLAIKCNPDTVAFFQASPYPGTRFYKMAKDAGYLRPDAKWSDFAIVSNTISPVNLPGLPAEAIHAWVKKAYRSFYLNPRYLMSQLRQIRSLHDLKNIFQGGLIFLRILLTSK